ncbi:MAG: hypothetical protein K8T26_06585 [Lentisphaerae bacterium]|nr:hypothetical protein [Lentisphaerota bacterium]
MAPTAGGHRSSLARGRTRASGRSGEAKVLIVRSKQVTASTIEAGRSLSLIVRAGAGVNTIDLDAASRRGTYVANCPGKNTEAVAELAIGLLIACDRGMADATQSLRAGRWQKKTFGKAMGLKTRRLGIIGTGAIGVAVARRAQALGMKIMAWSRSLTPGQAEAWGFEFAPTPQAETIPLIRWNSRRRWSAPRTLGRPPNSRRRRLRRRPCVS